MFIILFYSDQFLNVLAVLLSTQAQQAKTSTEIQQKLAAAHQQWKQEHDSIVQKTVKQALAEAKHEYEGMYCTYMHMCIHTQVHTCTYVYLKLVIQRFL